MLLSLQGDWRRERVQQQGNAQGVDGLYFPYWRPEGGGGLFPSAGLGKWMRAEQDEGTNNGREDEMCSD